MESAVQPPVRAGQSRLAGMDALRGIAALLVVFFHLDYLCGTHLGFARGYLAVDLFFALSGYVMARSYEPRMAAGMGPAGFLRARLRRLWPTMAVGAFFGLLVFLTQWPLSVTLPAFAFGLAMLPLFGPLSATFPINSPAWSIFFELCANFAHALVLRRLGAGALLAISLASAGVLFAFGRGFDVGVDQESFVFAFPRLLVSYCMGIALYRLLRDRALVACEWGLALLVAGILAASLVPADQIWPGYAFALVGVPAMIVSGLSAARFAARPLALLGEMSFPLYAVHFPVINLARLIGMPPAVCLLAALAAAYVLRPLANPAKRSPRRIEPLPA